MLYNKKGFFFKKVTAKIVGNSSHKRKGDKCHTVQRAPSSHHHQDKNGGLPQLIAVTTKSDVIMSSALPTISTNNSANNTTSIPAPNKPALSGLLAAKLQCNEWGLHSRTQASHAKKVPVSNTQTASSSSSSPKRRRQPLQRPRLANNKVHHPSYKPPIAQRSASMKERREAMENNRRYHNQYFSSSLYRIDEVDEKGLD